MCNPADGKLYFKNLNPLHNEQPIYYVTTEPEKNRVNYVNMAFMPSSIKGGFILLIIKTDSEANEAASNLLLHGILPPGDQ